MSSSRKVLWYVPGVGKLKCQKKDPTKVSFWLECAYFRDDACTKLKSDHTYFLELHYLHTSTLEKAIKWTVENLERFQRTWTDENDWIKKTYLALDYLYAELGRRVDKGSIS